MSAAKGIMAVIAALALAATTASCSQKHADSSLLSSLSTFIEYKISQNYEGLWDSSSDEWRRSNDDDEEHYEKYVRSHGFYPNKVDVLSISESKSEAEVKVKVQYVENDGNSAGSAMEEWRFVYENGGWYFDGYRTISESAE